MWKGFCGMIPPKIEPIEATLDFSAVMVPTSRPEHLKKVKRFVPPPWTTAEIFRRSLMAAYQCYLHRGALDGFLIARMAKVKPEDIDKLLVDESFRAALRYRGVDDVGGSFLTQEMEAALLIVMDPHDGRTMAQKLKAAGINNTKYQAFMRNPTFKRLVNEQSEFLLANTHEALVGLAKKVGEGDLNAIKFQLEVNKRYNPRSEALMGQQEFLGNIVEIIIRNVTEPELLGKIMTEFKQLAEKSETALPQRQIEGTILNG